MKIRITLGDKSWVVGIDIHQRTSWDSGPYTSSLTFKRFVQKPSRYSYNHVDFRGLPETCFSMYYTRLEFQNCFIFSLVHFPPFLR